MLKIQQREQNSTIILVNYLLFNIDFLGVFAALRYRKRWSSTNELSRMMLVKHPINQLPCVFTWSNATISVFFAFIGRDCTHVVVANLWTSSKTSDLNQFVLHPSRCSCFLVALELVGNVSVIINYFRKLTKSDQRTWLRNSAWFFFITGFCCFDFSRMPHCDGKASILNNERNPQL